MRILKFGGTPVGTPDCLRTALTVVEQNSRADRTVIVVSTLAGVTNRLVEAIDAAVLGEAVHTRLRDELRARHGQMCEEFVCGKWRGGVEGEIDRWLETLAGWLQAVTLLHECTPRTDDGHGAARVDLDESRRLAREYFASLPPETIPVVSGFIGSTASGVTTTLGRSGSDYTAAILGNFLDASSVEICTDTDGVMSADPRRVREAVPLPPITYREAADLSLFGAQVLHPKTVQPLEARGIPLTIRNSFRPQSAGTIVVRDSVTTTDSVKSITSHAGTTLFIVRTNSGILTATFYHRLLEARAHHRGNRLTYLASFDGATATVGLAEVISESAFVRLGPSENAVHYYSDRHSPLPPTIQGIGAGPEVTARGVLADVIHTALEIAA